MRPADGHTADMDTNYYDSIRRNDSFTDETTGSGYVLNNLQQTITENDEQEYCPVLPSETCVIVNNHVQSELATNEFIDDNTGEYNYPVILHDGNVLPAASSQGRHANELNNGIASSFMLNISMTHNEAYDIASPRNSAMAEGGGGERGGRDSLSARLQLIEDEEQQMIVMSINSDASSDDEESSHVKNPIYQSQLSFLGSDSASNG